jgi:lipoprotein-releasing system ATP-binding protein
MTALDAQSLAKSYPTVDGPLGVLADVSLRLDRGQNAAILGPSGSGKSTLLSLLGALDRPSSGRMSLDGVDPFALDDERLAVFRSRKIGFVFQEHHLLPQCSALENVLTPLLADGAAGEADVDRARRLLERVGLGARATHRPAQLSGGERQRVALARALVRQPVLLLADEPTGNLDRSTAASVVELLLELQAESDAILVAVTHSESLAAKMQRRYELDAGRLRSLA